MPQLPLPAALNVQQHQQRELSVREVKGPQRVVKASGQNPCRTLHMPAETTVANPKRRVMRNLGAI
jgi:hypothetical protein